MGFNSGFKGLRTLRPIYMTDLSLPSRCCILYIFSTNISTEYFKHVHTLGFSLQNAVYFIMLPVFVPVLFTFYIQGVLKFKCKTPVTKVNKEKNYEMLEQVIQVQTPILLLNYPYLYNRELSFSNDSK